MGTTYVRRARATGRQTSPHLDDLLDEYLTTRERCVRNQIVESQLHLVDFHVSHFKRSGWASEEDLRQTALIALIGAVERFDRNGGASLGTFASRTIEGELKRYLRDNTWLVRPPRVHQEIHLRIRHVAEELTQSLHRAPTVCELAAQMGLTADQVVQGLVAGATRDSRGTRGPSHREEASEDGIFTNLGDSDVALDLAEIRIALNDGIADLTPRQQHVLSLRFLDELSQPEIAQLIGVSQSYVSRLVRGALVRLRSSLET